jgi:hypothetical protein
MHRFNRQMLKNLRLVGRWQNHVSTHTTTDMPSNSLTPLIIQSATLRIYSEAVAVESQQMEASTKSVSSNSGNSREKRWLEASPEPKVRELRQTLERHRSERQLVVIQDFPDPDALSSAWAYQLIAQQYNIQCDIVYAGTLSHQENIALVKLTNLPAKRWGVQNLKERDLSIYQGCVLIDNQGTTSQLMPLVKQAGIPSQSLIDHHSLPRATSKRNSPIFALRREPQQQF